MRLPLTLLSYEPTLSPPRLISLRLSQKHMAKPTVISGASRRKRLLHYDGCEGTIRTIEATLPPQRSRCGAAPGLPVSRFSASWAPVRSMWPILYLIEFFRFKEKPMAISGAEIALRCPQVTAARKATNKLFVLFHNVIRRARITLEIGFDQVSTSFTTALVFEQ